MPFVLFQVSFWNITLKYYNIEFDGCIVPWYELNNGCIECENVFETYNMKNVNILSPQKFNLWLIKVN